MKKFLITCVGLLLLVTYGCSSEEAKEATEKNSETAVEEVNKTAGTAGDAVKETKKKPPVEGC
jgi:uncharacterized protein YcfL